MDGLFSPTHALPAPGPDASMAMRRDYLEHQLDSLTGKEISPGLRVVGGHSNRLHGGTQAQVHKFSRCRTICITPTSTYVQFGEIQSIPMNMLAVTTIGVMYQRYSLLKTEFSVFAAGCF